MEFKTLMYELGKSENWEHIKIDPECAFFVEIFETLEALSLDLDVRDRNSQFKNKVKKPLIKLCNEIINRLPFYIKGELNYQTDDTFYCDDLVPFIEYDLTLQHTEFEKEKNEFDFKISMAISKEDFVINILLDDLKVSFIDKNLYKNLDILKHKYQQVFQLIKTNIYFCSINYKKIFYPEYIHVIFDQKDYYNYEYISTIDCVLKLLPEEILEKSLSQIVDLVIETLNYFLPIVFASVLENPLPAIEQHFTTWNPQYNFTEYANEINIEPTVFETWIHTLERKKQIIFYGSPGTGKTFIANNLAKYLISGGDGFCELIQFHPAYTYEDFIQGIRPQTKDNGQLEYNIVLGRFLEFCQKAEACKNKCVLIIDEINRANLTQVFGELMYLLEYREQEIRLSGSQEKFKIPDNVYNSLLSK